MHTTEQAPLPSGFGRETTAAEALGDTRLDGKVAIVTGGYAGIGLETVRVLAGAGAKVIAPARSVDKARAALEGIPGVEIARMDLGDPASIDAFSREFLGSKRPLHSLIANAGIMGVPLVRDARGYESHLATNHLGHFQLTARLWPALLRAGGARVVSLSSRGHARSGIEWEDPFFERRPYDKWLAYGQSKTANVLFAVGLDRRGRDRGVRAFAVHPGVILETDLGRSLSSDEKDAAVANAQKIGMWAKTVAQGAATSVWCATSRALDGKGGVYCEDVDIAARAPEDPRIANGVRQWAIDPDQAERLWKASEGWTGVSLDHAAS